MIINELYVNWGREVASMHQNSALMIPFESTKKKRPHGGVLDIVRTVANSARPGGNA